MGVYQRPIHPDELYHFGVLGMKWGVRRYQNPDGSLTPAGREHYDIGENDNPSDEKDNNKPQSTENKTSNEKVKKYLKTGLIVAGGLLATYGAYKLSSAITDDNEKWQKVRLFVDDFLKKDSALKIAKNKAAEVAKTYGDRSKETVKALKNLQKKSNDRFNASAKMTEYNMTELNKNPNMFQKIANRKATTENSYVKRLKDINSEFEAKANNPKLDDGVDEYTKRLLRKNESKLNNTFSERIKGLLKNKVEETKSTDELSDYTKELLEKNRRKLNGR